MSHKPVNLDDLRLRAEQAIQHSQAGRPGNSDPSGQLDLTKLIEELRIYQAELEIQNQELGSAQVSLAKTLDKYRNLFENLPLPAIVIDARGFIAEANAQAIDFLGLSRFKHLQGMLIYRLFDTAAQTPLYALLNEPSPAEPRTLTRLPLKVDEAASLPCDVHLIRLSTEAIHGHQNLVVLVDQSAQVALQRSLISKERHELANLATANVVWDWNLHTGELWWNQSLETTFGYGPGELAPVMDAWLACIHPEDRARVEAGRQAALDTGQSAWSAEYRFRRQDGTYATVEDHGVIHRNAKGQAVRIAGALHDITERKASEARLASAAERYANMLKATKDAFWLVDRATGRLLDVNAAATTLSGYRRDELLSMRVLDLDIGFNPETYAAQMEQILAKGGGLFETQHRTKDGRVIDVEISTLPDAQAQTLVGFIRDISERKRIERDLQAMNTELAWRVAERTAELTQRTLELQNSEERYRLAMKVTSDGLWDFHMLTHKAYCSPNYFAMLGYGPTELGDDLDSVFSELLHPDEREAVLDRIRICFETEVDYESEFRMRAKDGGYRWILSRGQVIERDASGRPARAVGTHIDITQRKQAEDELRAVSNYSRRLIEASLDPLVTISPEGRIMDVNAATEAVTGWPRERLIGTDFCDYFTDPDQARAGYLQVFAEGSVTDYPLAIRHADGHVTDVLYNASVYRNDAGEIAGVFAAARDITERKRAEEELLAVSNYSRRLIEASLDPLVTISPEGRIMDVNAATEAVTGWPRDRLIGTDFCDYFTDPDQARAGYQQVFAEGSVTDYPLAIRHADGHVTDVLYNASVYRNDAGEIAGVFAAARDITQRKRDEERLRESEQRFRGLFEFLPIAYQSLDIQGHWLDGNQKLADLLGFERPEELLGLDFGEYWVEEKRDLFPGTFDQLKREQRILGELSLRRRDGQPIAVELSGRVQRDAEGQFLRTHCVLVDVTERRQLEDQIREINANLEQKVALRTAQLALASKAKSEFLANMSHEIRTPMNAILGLTQILERGALTPDQRDILSKISSSGVGLLHIINDILDISKMEAGQFKIEQQSFELPPVLARLRNLLLASAHDKGVALVVPDAGDMPGPLVGDPLRIEQVLINLISNAIKFTPAGRVELRIRLLQLTDTTARLRFEVRDTGIGISPEALAKLFQPFTQADASTTRRFGGTGLGLSISKRLVELMGGVIGADSTLEAGSTFWFELPLGRGRTAEFATEHPAAPVEAAGPQLRGLRVLAVDDNRINLFMLERALQLEGAVVSLAADGQQALQTLAANPQGFDVVLMDIQMPVMDGLTATREIRQDSALARLPVIALTAGVLAEEREAALNAGVNDFLAKPLDLQRMKAMLTPFLSPTSPEK